MIELAYFGHDAGDAAIRRRVSALESDGVNVTGFMMRRDAPVETGWTNIDLGQTRDGAMVQRIASIFSGAKAAAAHVDALRRADVILARNLDMLACAFETKRRLGLDTPVIYECLDIHRHLSRTDAAGAALRRLEKSLLERCSGLIVSSPAFLKQHFERYYPGAYTPYLLENRLTEGDAFGPRPSAAAPEASTGALRIGWFGNLRCERSFRALLGAADQLGDAVEIILRGKPSRNEITIFEPEIEKRANVNYGGPYKAPGDLAAIYKSVDVVWSGDYMEAGQNSVWLLPNRLYEGGYFATPPIAPAGTQTAAWIDKRRTGFVIDEPVEDSLPRLLDSLTADRSRIVDCRNALLAWPVSDFVQPVGTLSALLEDVLGRSQA